MVIYRDGKEIELTEREMIDAYYEQQNKFDVNYITNYLVEAVKESYVSESDAADYLRNNKKFAERVAYRYRKYLEDVISGEDEIDCFVNAYNYMWSVDKMKERDMTKKMMQKIKEFAEHNWSAEDENVVSVEHLDQAVSNPWMDRSGRFALTDEGAIKEWGLDVVMDFCEKAKAKIKEEEPVLCGFVWCHGKKDFSVHEVDLSVKDREKIGEILCKYMDSGSSVRNAWNEKISDMFNDEY